MTARDTLSALRIESGERWIDAAEPFQLEDALAVLEGEAPFHFLTRARGASKTTDLAAVALALLLDAEDASPAVLDRRRHGPGHTRDRLDRRRSSSRTPMLADDLEIQTKPRARRHRLAHHSKYWRLTRPEPGDCDLAAVFADELAQLARYPAAAPTLGSGLDCRCEVAQCPARSPYNRRRPGSLLGEGLGARNLELTLAGSRGSRSSSLDGRGSAGGAAIAAHGVAHTRGCS